MTWGRNEFQNTPVVDANELLARVQQSCDKPWTQLHLLGPREHLDEQACLLELSRVCSGDFDQTSVFRLDRLCDLTTLIRAGKLRTLSLCGYRLSPAAWRRLTHLKHSLEGLYLLYNVVGLDGSEVRSERAPVVTELISLGFSGNSFGPRGTKAIARQLRHLANLTSFQLCHHNMETDGMTSRDIRSIATRFAQPIKLTKIAFKNNEIDSAGAKVIAEWLPRLTGLRSLDLEDNNIGTDGAKALAKDLPRVAGLTSLILTGNGIGAEGAIAIAEQLPYLTAIRVLGLASNAIGRDGSLALASMFPKMTKLTALDLASNSVDAIGAKAIAEHLPYLTELSRFDLRDNEIDDDGVQALATSTDRLIGLRYFFATKNRIQCVEEALLQSGDAKQIFRAVLRGVTLPHGRVILMGMGCTGKTWLRRRCFQNEIVLPGEKRNITKSIDFLRAEESQVPLGEYLKSQDAELRTTIWDFGGQTVKHGVHEGFLTKPDERTVYLLVLSARRPLGTGTGETDETTGNRLDYWLKTIRHFVGSSAPVVIAITQHDDDNPSPEWSKSNRPVDEKIVWTAGTDAVPLCEAKEEWLRDKYGVNVVRIVDKCSATDRSGKADDSIIKLRHAIAEAMEQHTKVLKARVPFEYPRLAERVERNLRRRTWAPIEDYMDWCNSDGLQISNQTTQQTFLRLLDAQGRLFFFGETESEEQERLLRRGSLPPGRLYHNKLAKRAGIGRLDHAVINPLWMKHCVYEIVDASEQRDWFRFNDHIKPTIASATHETGVVQSPEDDALILDFLLRTQLCWYARDEEEYLFPRGLPLATAQDFELWEQWTQPEFLTWDYLPEANFFRLIVELHQTNGTGCVVKRRGRFQQGRNWVRIFNPDDERTEAVIIADSDQCSLSVRLSPDGSEVLSQQQRLLARITFEMEKIQGTRSNCLPTTKEKSQDAGGQGLQACNVEPNASFAFEQTAQSLKRTSASSNTDSQTFVAVRPLEEAFAIYEQLCELYRSLPDPSQAAVAKCLHISESKVGRAVQRLLDFLIQQRKLPKESQLISMKEKGGPKSELTDLGVQAKEWVSGYLSEIRKVRNQLDNWEEEV